MFSWTGSAAYAAGEIKTTAIARRAATHARMANTPASDFRSDAARGCSSTVAAMRRMMEAIATKCGQRDYKCVIEGQTLVVRLRFVGWAKRSVPTTFDQILKEKWWARRKRAFAHPTSLYVNAVARNAAMMPPMMRYFTA